MTAICGSTSGVPAGLACVQPQGHPAGKHVYGDTTTQQAVIEGRFGPIEIPDPPTMAPSALTG